MPSRDGSGIDHGPAYMTQRGRFITFEGIDGAGKSTQLAHAAAWLRARDIDPVVTREPGGTVFGEGLRALLLDPDTELSGRTELLAVFAARSHHLEQVLVPALTAGRWVLCDRFTDATVAYQHFGRGVPREAIETLRALVHPTLEPDRTFVFDVPLSVAVDRRTGRSEAADRFEREADAFHERVAAGYRQLALESRERFVLVSDHVVADVIAKSLEENLRQCIDLWVEPEISGEFLKDHGTL